MGGPMPFWKHERVRPAQIIIIGFLLLILVGTGLLMLPLSTNDGSGASLHDALFTATSATCVTGLVAVDTYSTFTGFGQAVVLAMIQIGGLGLVTCWWKKAKPHARCACSAAAAVLSEIIRFIVSATGGCQNADGGWLHRFAPCPILKAPEPERSSNISPARRPGSTEGRCP